MRHLIDPTDLSVPEINGLLALAEDIMQNPAAYAHQCDGKILCTCFYEPSTRTRLSFESAMLSLGGQVIGFHEAGSSSASKGESVADTIRVISSYADICAIRHPKEGAALVASRYASIPVINAGDGGHHHPTQTLTDLLTIRAEKGAPERLTVGFCGDLKFGRTVHSLLRTLTQYPHNRFILVSPAELRLPDYLRDELIGGMSDFTEAENLEKHIPDMDVLYMTRVQRERFFNEEEYIRLRDTYILDNQKLQKAKPDLAILHPLPRVNEIAPEVDGDPRARYFEQVKYGKFIRMALILKLLNG